MSDNYVSSVSLSLTVCGLVSQPHQATVVLSGLLGLSCCGHHRRLWGSALSSTQTLGRCDSLPLTITGPVQAYQTSTQLHPNMHPLRRLWEILGPINPTPETAATPSGKPNSSSSSANPVALPSFLWCGPHKPAQHSLWDELLAECQMWTKTNICLPVVFPVTYLTFLPTGSRSLHQEVWAHPLFCFSFPSSFQCPRPEREVFLLLPLFSKDSGSVTWARKGGHPLPLYIYSPLAFWLSLNNKQGGQERDLFNKLT